MRCAPSTSGSSRFPILAANGLPTAELPSEAVYLEKHEELNLFALNTEQEWQQALEKCPEQMLPFESGAPR